MAKIPEFPASDSWYRHFVSYGETDTMGVLYYGEYFHILERSRNFYIRERGMKYAEVEKRGILLPVREAQCRYRAPIRFDDEIYIRVGIHEWKQASMKFIYEIQECDPNTTHRRIREKHPDKTPCRLP